LLPNQAVDHLTLDQNLELFRAQNPHPKTKKLEVKAHRTSTFSTSTTSQTNMIVKPKQLTPQPNNRKNKAQPKKATQPTTKKKWQSKRPQPRKKTLR